MTKEPSFFDFAAEVGLTKHIGGRDSTEELMQLCHIGKDSFVLDVGCGVGVTPCFIAQQHGCLVIGVDISARMIERCQERARREQVADRVRFIVADAQALPLQDDLFDAVMTESVTAFPEDKQRAVTEYTRVTKPGGYVGLNESVWLRVPPPPDVMAWAAQDLGATVQPLESDAWVGLMEAAGLTEITGRAYTVNTQKETREILKRYGWRGMLAVATRMVMLFARSPAYRRFVKQVGEEGITPDHLEEYFGYGLFVGQKRGGG